MAENNGYIKLFRKLVMWGWYQDNVVKSVFLHLLLTANYKDNIWKGELVSKGSLVTSYQNLSASLGFSVQQVRTAVAKLKSTGEITIKATSRYTVLTLINWEDYQGIEENTTSTLTSSLTSNQQTDNKQSTSNQQAINKQSTTTKEGKEGKKDKKVRNSTITVPTFEDVAAYCKERKNDVDPKAFFDFYSAGDWVDSRGNAVRNWKQKLITWEKKQTPKDKKENQTDRINRLVGEMEGDFFGV